VSEPDVAGNTFRGSEPSGLHALATDWGLTPVVLPRVYRYGTEVWESITAIASRIGTAGMGMQRKATTVPGRTSSLFTLVAPSEQREANDIARLVQEARLVDGVPAERIAVIARRGRRVQALVRELGHAGIPARGSIAGSAVRDQPAARELLDIVALGRGLQPLTPARAIDVLTGRYGRMSSQDLRRLRFQMRVAAESDEDRDTKPYRSVDTLIADALGHRGGFSFLPEAATHNATMMAEVLDDIRGAPPTVPVTEVLWSVVSRTGVIDTWRRQALRPGPGQSGAHQALDSLMALFQQAQDFVESQPGASLEVFLESVVEADVPDDVVLPEPAWPAVTVATPPGVAGQEFDVVIVAGVNDGVWPDLRLRGSLLAAHQLVRAHRGEADDTLDERKIVQDDELRLCVLALSRATATVIVTAVESEETQPSPLFRIIQSRSTPVASRFDPPLSIRATTGRLRRELVTTIRSGAQNDLIAQDLALLASWGAPGAHPDSWWGTLEPSSEAALYEDGDVPISPSALQRLEDSPVEWFLGTLARHDSSPDRGLGSLIHQALERHPAGTAAHIWDSVEARFGQLEYEAGWIEQYHRRIAKAMVEALADYLSDRATAGYSLVSSEQIFHLRHDRAVITGYIDRIERDAEGALIVVDLKTGNHSTDSQVVDNPQMLTYQLALETPELLDALDTPGALSGGAALLFVKSGVRGKRYRMAVQAPIDEESRASLLERIERAVETISQAHFLGDPLSFGPVGTPSAHRWHFIGQVCGDV
jgi:RecB family exonuclease